MRPPPRLVLLVAAGGAAGAVLRHALGTWIPDGAGFPWTTLLVNGSGSFLLALLPALPRVRGSAAWTVALGPGLLGGYTTLSAYAEQARDLMAEGRTAVAAAYVVGTLVVCCAAVLLADRWSTPSERAELAAEGGDE